MSEKPQFIERLEKNGCCASVVSARHLEDLRKEISSLRDEGLLSKDIDREYGGAYFSPKLPRTMKNARSIIVVAVPQPMIRTTFHWQGRAVKAIVPPTYFDAYKVIWRARNVLKEAFRPRQYQLARAVLPVKLLAVRSGLAKYGRSNITYIPRYGSFHRLTAFYSDYDAPIDYWQKKEALPLCAKCTVCLKAYPTGAIRKGGFMIKAERCLTYLNERDSKHGFPTWVGRSAHNSLIGCMRCQKSCPYDKGVADWYEDRGAFSEAETAYLLRGRYKGNDAAKMKRKLARLGLDLSVFPRNLRVLLEQER